MASHQLALTPVCTLTRSLQPRRSISLEKRCSASVVRPVPRMAVTKSCKQNAVIRRSANYIPPVWEDNFVQSLRSDYVGEMYTARSNKLKADVRKMQDQVVEPLDQLELIDILQRLGLAYHFEEDIKGILKSIHSNNYKNDEWKNENLYAVALEFRLLRQHEFNVSQEVFDSFKDEMGNFKACLCEDTKGMLSLYEASYLSIEGEGVLDEARNFTAKHLEEYLKENKDDENILSILVSHALELPLYWSMLRLEARWFIDVYERQQHTNPIMLELAKLDFNMVQATHQEDLKHLSWWWTSTDLGEKLSFARNRLIENFFWTVGAIFDPQFGYCRRMNTKSGALITAIDDFYDVYGTLDELEIFTDVVERWDIDAIDQLPDSMKICFLALYNTINEMGYVALKEHDSNIIPNLKKVWADLCKAYLVEAKWYYSGYTPTLQEYLENAWISISAPLLLVQAYFFVTNPITKEAMECLEEYPNIIRWSSMIIRLADDLGTSTDEMKRGDVPKSIQCYMHETGASEEDARDHIRYLISETWKKMNEDRVATSPFSPTFIQAALNFARMSQCIYQYGDGNGVPDRETKDRVLLLLIHPIPLT